MLSLNQETVRIWRKRWLETTLALNTAEQQVHNKEGTEEEASGEEECRATRFGLIEAVFEDTQSAPERLLPSAQSR